MWIKMFYDALDNMYSFLGIPILIFFMTLFKINYIWILSLYLISVLMYGIIFKIYTVSNLWIRVVCLFSQYCGIAFVIGSLIRLIF